MVSAPDPRPTRRRPRASRRAVLAGMVAVGIGAGVLANAADARWSPAGPTAVRVPVGEDALVDRFRLHVSAVTPAATLTVTEAISEEVDRLETDGVWVVVALSYARLDDDGAPWGALLQDTRGREFPVSPRAGSDHQPWIAGTELWVAGQLVFEVPTDALDGLELRFVPEQSEVAVPLHYGRTPLDLRTDDVVPSLELAPPVVLDRGERS